MRTNIKLKSLSAIVDVFFVVSGEMIPENGEDSHAFSFNDCLGMMGVFDGCGGIGSRKYPEYCDKTGAYIASRTAGNVVVDWYKRLCSAKEILSDENMFLLCEELHDRLKNRLASYNTTTESSIMRGSLTKNFPTTAAVVLLANYNDIIHSSFIWAGDSRGFILDDKGLTQVTRDDIDENTDALSNLSVDSRLTNVVTADDEFRLNYRNFVSDEPTIFITATDGCFAYFSTPMEFEYMLIETMQRSENIEQWKFNIDEYIKQYASDDYTIGIVACKYGNFGTMKNSFTERFEMLKDEYISKLEDADETTRLMMWDEYKKTYYRGA